MANPRDKHLSSKAELAAGILLLVVAGLWLVWGMGRFVWLDGVQLVLMHFRLVSTPIVLVLLIIYVIWAARHGRFDGLRAKDEHSANFVCNLADRRVAGVCSGLAQHFAIDTTSVRVVALGLLFLVPVIAILAYAFAALVFRPF